MRTMLTKKGWVELDAEGVAEGDHQCRCGEEAVKIIEAGEDLLWAVCRGCSHEVHCESAAAAKQSEYEMDYYAGYE